MVRFSKEEKNKLKQFIREQKKIRKVSARQQFQEDFGDILDHIREEIYFHTMDFIKENNFHEDREKLVKVWKYMEKNLK